MLCRSYMRNRWIVYERIIKRTEKKSTLLIMLAIPNQRNTWTQIESLLTQVILNMKESTFDINTFFQPIITFDILHFSQLIKKSKIKLISNIAKFELNKNATEYWKGDCHKII